MFIQSHKARSYIRSLPYSPPVRFDKTYPKANPLAIDLLQKMLVFDPKQRITCDEALAHPWLAEGTKALPTTALPTLLPEMKAMQAKRRMKAAFLAVQASERMAKVMGS